MAFHVGSRLIVFAALVLLVAGCNLSRQKEPVVVTATPSGPILVQEPPPTATDAPAALTDMDVTPSPAPTLPAPPTATPTIPPRPTDTPTAVLIPTFTPPQATRTPAGPPTVLPLDDGSGNVLPGTGSVNSPIAGVENLPETLYYLSDGQGAPQVWRLRYGFAAPEQLSFSATGVAAFDVAPDGTLAYLTPGGEMVIGGVPFGPPPAPEGSLPQVTALAWSPGGDWLAYTLRTPGADQGAGGPHPADGLYIRDRAGQSFFLEPNVYAASADDASARVFGGPMDWRPDGTEILVTTELAGGRAASRVNITTSAALPVWNTGTLPPGAYDTARWSVNGNAMIASGAGQVLRIEPDTLGVQVLLGTNAGLLPEGAQQFANGAVTFAAGPTSTAGPKRLYLIPAGQADPVPVSEALTESGRVEFLWDNLGQQTLLVVYEPGDSPLGAPLLRDQSGALRNLTALTGSMGSPRWGPAFKPGDAARVQTTAGDSLNLRAEPAGALIVPLATGTRVTVLGGPRRADGMAWWRVRTADGITGWAVESVIGPDGLPLRTLVPAP
ncbi:MAG: SH3 domain-containing protein [Lentisphaerae bacterium]|nr:SH3 domain-containing protein [Lentisphaerota bacterium]